MTTGIPTHLLLLEQLKKDLASNQSILDNLNSLGPVQLGLKNATNPQETLRQLQEQKDERRINIDNITKKISELLTPITQPALTPVAQPTIKQTITELIPEQLTPLNSQPIPGQTNKIPFLPIAAAVGVGIVIFTIIRKKRK